MGVNGGVSRGSSQIFMLTIPNMLMGSRITIFFGESKINDINEIFTLAKANQEIIWFDIAMNEIFGVDIFQASNQLISKHNDGFQREASVAVGKEFF
jgi:uncharacterized protein YuzE